MYHTRRQPNPTRRVHLAKNPIKPETNSKKSERKQEAKPVKQEFGSEPRRENAERSDQFRGRGRGLNRGSRGGRGNGRGQGRGRGSVAYFSPNRVNQFIPPQMPRTTSFPTRNFTDAPYPHEIFTAEVPAHILSSSSCSQIRYEQRILEKKLEKRRLIAVEAMKLAQQRDDYHRGNDNQVAAMKEKENVSPLKNKTPESDGSKVVTSDEKAKSVSGAMIETARRVLFKVDDNETEAPVSPQLSPSDVKKPRAIVKTNQSGYWTDEMMRRFRAMSVVEETQPMKKVIRYSPDEMARMDIWTDRCVKGLAQP